MLASVSDSHGEYVHSAHGTNIETKQSTANDRNSGDAVDVANLVTHGGVLSCQSPYRWIYRRNPEVDRCVITGEQQAWRSGCEKGLYAMLPSA